MKVHINLNESVKVKLTDYAKDIYYHQYDEVNKLAGKQIIKPSYPKVDEDGYATFQLWGFMRLFGPYIMHYGGSAVASPLEIIYDAEGAEHD